jgi:hypothetical protein
MKTTGRFLTAFCFVSGAIVAGCSSGSVVLAPAAQRPAPDTATLPAPFAVLQFDVLPIGPQITDGYDCPVGILTSAQQLPDAGARRPARAPRGIFPITGGCDPTTGFPVVSPIPDPPTPSPVPLASAGLATQNISAPSVPLALPAVAGWTGTLSFPACAPGSCDAGTTNGSVALNVLQSTTTSSYTFALIFTNSGPEHLTAPTPGPSEHPAPHVWTLYGPPPKTAATSAPSPVETRLSGAPITIGFPSLTVAVPANSGIDPSKLVLTVAQVLTPPTYEIAIDKRDAAGNFLTIPLTSSATYAPYASTATLAKFALPSTRFAFQTDFTQYDFTLAPAK